MAKRHILAECRGCAERVELLEDIRGRPWFVDLEKRTFLLTDNGITYVREGRLVHKCLNIDPSADTVPEMQAFDGEPERERPTSHETPESKRKR